MAKTNKIFRVVNDTSIYGNAKAADYGDDVLMIDKNGGIYLGNETIYPINISNISLKNVTYNNLVSLRDNSQLIPGSFYRITDYITTTTQENTQSAGHQFDVIVLATSTSELNENAKAICHEGDTYFSENGANLDAWELKYSLDNDTTRFSWADTTNGKGVIYYMKDEWNNECPYDFKNIMFKNPFDTDDLNFYYTFNRCTSNGHEDMTVILVDTYDNGWTLYPKHIATNNIISTAFDKGNTKIHILNFIIFIEKTNFSHDSDDYLVDDIVESFYNNKFSINCVNMIFENSSYNNIFGEGCNRNKFKELCYSNTFGNNCYSNSFGNNCYSNSFGNNCHSNSFGNNCHSNSFEDDCYHNKFGYNCNSNSFGNYCNYNVFGNNCEYNSFGDYCYSTSFGNNCSSNSFGNGCYRNKFGYNCNSNSFGNYCNNNVFGNNCEYNSFGNNCYSTSFGNSYSDLKNYYTYNSFGDGCMFINLANDETASLFNTVRKYKFAQGFRGTESSPITITTVRNRDYETKVAINSAGEIKIYCEADLIA